jgi:hypothetical protein
MNGYLIIFKLPPKKKNVEVSMFCQKFYGQDTSSWGGKYRYHRKGLMDDIPHRKLLRGVIVINSNDVETVLEFLKGYDAQVHVREMKLTEMDKTILKKGE